MYAVHNGGEGAAGYFGEAVLRLFGVAAQFKSAFKKLDDVASNSGGVSALAPKKLKKSLKNDPVDLGANSLFGYRYAKAANRLGIDLSRVQIRDGVAHLKIGFAHNLNPADLGTLREFLRTQGASKAVVDSGFVINPKLNATLRRLASSGRPFNGGQVRLIDSDNNIFEIVFENLD
jgi:hypothetical protein